ncbi:MAG: hypothetical protein ACK559_12215, partial [bacterium]
MPDREPRVQRDRRGLLDDRLPDHRRVLVGVLRPGPVVAERLLDEGAELQRVHARLRLSRADAAGDDERARVAVGTDVLVVGDPTSARLPRLRRRPHAVDHLDVGGRAELDPVRLQERPVPVPVEVHVGASRALEDEVAEGIGRGRGRARRR